VVEGVLDGLLVVVVLVVVLGLEDRRHDLVAESFRRGVL